MIYKSFSEAKEDILNNFIWKIKNIALIHNRNGKLVYFYLEDHILLDEENKDFPTLVGIEVYETGKWFEVEVFLVVIDKRSTNYVPLKDLESRVRVKH